MTAKERVHIAYQSARGDTPKDVELPCKLLVMGDFVGDKEACDLAARQSLPVARSLNHTLAEIAPSVTMVLPEACGGGEFTFAPKTMADFEPGELMRQVNVLRELAQQRDALCALRARMHANRGFRDSVTAHLKLPAGDAQ